MNRFLFRRGVRHGLAAVVAAVLLVACGGGDPSVPGSGSPAGAPTTKGSFTALVSFGDSLSDVGSYAPATSIAGNGQAPYFGGRFTTNATTPGTESIGAVWVETVAASLGLLVTPHEMGFNAQSVKCPIAAVNAALASTCTGYAQGGALVTNPNGIGHDPVSGAGALTVPVKTQIANHLLRFGSFKASDLVMVFAGNNDVFVQFDAFVAKAAQIQAQAQAGQISADQASLALFAAQSQAQGEMKKAALELAAYVRDGILANGAVYVAVSNLPDSSFTPFGQAMPVEVRGVLTVLVDTFNLWLRDGLTDVPVQWIDAHALYADIHADPARFGIANSTVPACDSAKIGALIGRTLNPILDSYALFCNATPGAPYNGLRAGADALTWQFADAVHPTTLGHKLISDAFLAQLRAFGWI